MTAQPDNAEVIVRVEPRLLNDVLCVALRQHGLTVYASPAVERRRTRRSIRQYDVAIVTDALPRDAGADTVIRIDETGTPLDRDGVPVVGAEEAGLDGLLHELRRAIGEEPASCEQS